mgnify:CR=1 FL=1
MALVLNGTQLGYSSLEANCDDPEAFLILPTFPMLDQVFREEEAAAVLHRAHHSLALRRRGWA